MIITGGLNAQFDIVATSGPSDLIIEEMVYSPTCDCQFAVGSFNDQASIRRIESNGNVTWTEVLGPIGSTFTSLTQPEGRAGVVAAVGTSAALPENDIILFEIDCAGVVQFSNTYDVANPIGDGNTSRVVGTRVTRTEDGHGGYWIAFNNSATTIAVDNPAVIKVDVGGAISQDGNGVPIQYEYNTGSDDQMHGFTYNVGSQTAEILFYDTVLDGNPRIHGMLSVGTDGTALGAYAGTLTINGATSDFRPEDIVSRGDDNFVVGRVGSRAVALRFTRVQNPGGGYFYQTQMANLIASPLSPGTLDLSIDVAQSVDEISVGLTRNGLAVVVNLDFQANILSQFRGNKPYSLTYGGFANGQENLVLFGEHSLPSQGMNDYILHPFHNLDASCEVELLNFYNMQPANMTFTAFPNFNRTGLTVNTQPINTPSGFIPTTVTPLCPAPNPVVDVCQIECLECAYALSSELSDLPFGVNVTYQWTISLNGVVEMTSTDPNVIFIPSTDPATYDYTLVITDDGVSSTVNGSFDVNCACGPTAFNLTDMQHVAINGNTISRTHPGSGWSAGASTDVTLNTGDYLSYRVSENTPLMVGLSPTAPSIKWEDMHAAFYTMWNNRFYINREGVLQLMPQNYTSNDVFTVSLTSTDVVFFLNGAMVSSHSLQSAGQSMEVDITIWDDEGEIYDLQITQGCPFVGNNTITNEEAEEREIRIYKEKMQDEFKLFPNPANTAFSVEYLGGEEEEFEYRLYDAQGKLLDSKRGDKYNNTTKFTDLDYPTGTYFLNIISPTKGLLTTETIVIE